MTQLILIEHVSAHAIASRGCVGGANNVLQVYAQQKDTETSLHKNII